MVLFDFTVLCL